MKRILSVLLALAFCLLLCGCGEASPRGQGSASDVDVDLTALSTIVAFGKITEILDNQGDYIGKTVKVNGPFIAQYEESIGKYYYYVGFYDTTGCCVSGGIEFLWNGHEAFSDYPESGTEVELTGTFGLYEEYGYSYFYIDVSSFEQI